MSKKKKKKWKLHPSQNKPNFYDYINFLYYTSSTVENITLARYIDKHSGKEYYINIDGNNRINAITYFINFPLKIFNNYFKNFIVNPNITELFTFLKDKNYSEIINVRSIDKLIRKSNNQKIENIWQSIDSIVRGLIEDEFEKVQDKLKLKNDNPFHTGVKVNLIIFDQPSIDELSFIYKSINNNRNPLTKTDMMAAVLLTADEFKIKDEILNLEISKNVKKYYEEKDKNELLNVEKDNKLKKVNGFEFLLGFQNYLNQLSSLIPIFKGKNDLIFKLFDSKYVFFKLEPKYFDSNNIEFFYSKILEATKIFININENINDTYIKHEQFTKNSLNQKYGDNTLFIIFNIILGFLNKKIDRKKIYLHLKKILIYTLLIRNLKCKPEKKNFFIGIDDLRYEAGGSFILAKAKKMYLNPQNTGNQLNKEIFIELLDILIKQSNRVYNYMQKPKRRRVLNFYEKILLTTFYNQKVSKEYSNKKKSIEHIIPWSLKWRNDNDLLDLDRLGNLMILDLDKNILRRNNHIQKLYQKMDNNEIQQLKCMDPKIYDEIVEHNIKNNIPPILKEIERYNDACIMREKIYIDNLLNFIFD